MKFDKKELDEILNALESGDYNDLYDSVFYEQIIRPFKQKYKKSFSYDYGATKGVIIFEELGFVIKIPFGASLDSEFYGADCDNGWDYCKAEVNKYEFAHQSDLEQCFAKTMPIADINGHPIYIQEFAIMFNKDDGSSSNHTKDDIEKIKGLCEYNDYDCFNSSWLSDAFNFFGEKVFYQLMNFISDVDINDLHSGNLGYIGMRPVLVDYSSFND